MTKHVVTDVTPLTAALLEHVNQQLDIAVVGGNGQPFIDVKLVEVRSSTNHGSVIVIEDAAERSYYVNVEHIVSFRTTD